MARRSSFARLSVLLLVLSAPAVFAADAKPVATVGDRSISVADLGRRLATIPDFQRAALGDTPEKLKRQVLETLIVPDLLYSQEALRLKLDDQPAVRDREREILRQAMERALRAQSMQQSPVTGAEIEAYFEANRARFETPRRVRIWRILTDDEVLAKKIIEDSRGVDGLKRWSQYARESSLDKATQLRDGDLGFVHEDGKTDAPTLRVDPILFASADRLADGELAQEPIKEGTHWAVIWRRGSAPAVTRTAAQEQGSIRQVLERERLAQLRQAVLVELRAKYVSKTDESLLDTLHFNGEGLPTRARTTARQAHAAAAGSSLPAPTERGTR
ncbi:MAG TPA: peptidyl-prolyl cis-trans isomerase [Polyangiaceae bacterium]|jgi:peptidyl-prolyl cis-trans isomerase C|nr:peptidyl-prolyl cis-trans isomerase [Polyangiaceae bacterium]